MNKNSEIPGLEWLHETKVIAIIRGISRESIDRLVKALYAGGIRVIEVTLNTEGAEIMITHLQQEYGEKLWVGAGTVTNLEKAKAAHRAGAQFFVTPNLDEEVIVYGLEHDIQVFSGAMTPTEVNRAYELGATVVKVFPCGSLGTSYIKELKGPLAHIPMMAVGGVTLENAVEFIASGADVLGVGGSLVNKTLINQGEFATIEKNAKRFITAVRGGI